ncbi:MAG TPA: hypothetical protein V6C90_11980 [Coleofasciculaceae cyanobacterium]|jgi:hypothetical protein
MKFHNLRCGYQHLLRQFALVGLACFCLTSLAEAASLKTNKSHLSKNLSSHKILIAQAPEVCPEEYGTSLFVTAETENFLVYICGSELPLTYTGINKKNGDKITLPLLSYIRDQYITFNGDTRYTLTRTELLVTQKGNVILREKATWKRY